MSGSSQLFETLTSAFQEKRPVLRAGERAFKRFLQMGLPVKQEWGKQLPLEKLKNAGLIPTQARHFHAQDLPEGVRFLRQDEALKYFGSFMTSRAERQILEGGSVFAALNAAFAEDISFLSIPEKMKCPKPVLITQELATQANALFSPRLHIWVGKGAELELVIELSSGGDALTWMNSVLDLHLEEEAQLKLLLLAPKPLPCWVFQELYATLKEKSRLSIFSKSYGGLCHRQAFQCVLEGEHAQVEISSLVLGHGKHEAQISVEMDHRAPNGRSQQMIKALLDGTSRMSFDGKISIRPEGQGCEAYQLNRNLLLDPGAQAWSRPTLEIGADEVKASHGATTSALDEEPLFYLLSRGIDPETAKKLLVHAFCDEVFAKLSPEMRLFL